MSIIGSITNTYDGWPLTGNIESGTYHYVTICPYCGGSCISPEQCPRVKAIEYHPDGKVKNVKLRKKKRGKWTLTYGATIQPETTPKPHPVTGWEIIC